MTKTLTFLTMIAAKIMNIYEKNIKNDKNIQTMIAAKIMKSWSS